MQKMLTGAFSKVIDVLKSTTGSSSMRNDAPGPSCISGRTQSHDQAGINPNSDSDTDSMIDFRPDKKKIR